MSSKKGIKAMNVVDFKKIKDLQAYGLKPKQISDIVGRSRSTVDRVMSVETFADYITLIKQARQSWLAKQVKSTPVPELNVVKRDGFAEIKERDTSKLYMTAITNHRSTIYGLGSDNKVYGWTGEEWRLHR